MIDQLIAYGPLLLHGAIFVLLCCKSVLTFRKNNMFATVESDAARLSRNGH